MAPYNMMLCTNTNLMDEVRIEYHNRYNMDTISQVQMVAELAFDDDLTLNSKLWHL